MVHKCLNSLPCQEWEQVLLRPSQGESISTNQSNYRGKKTVQVSKGKSNSITIRSLPSKYSKPKSPSNVENQQVPIQTLLNIVVILDFQSIPSLFPKNAESNKGKSVGIEISLVKSHAEGWEVEREETNFPHQELTGWILNRPANGNLFERLSHCHKAYHLEVSKPTFRSIC